jgi:WD40 repeat protein
MPGCFVFGTSTGLVKQLKPIHHNQLHKAEILFKGQKPINFLTFSDSGNYLSITTEDTSTIVYCSKSKKLVKLPSEHDGYVSKAYFCSDEYAFSLGTEGKLLLYYIVSSSPPKAEKESESEDPFEEANEKTDFTLVDTYKIANEMVIRKYPFLGACYSSFEQNDRRVNAIFVGGQAFLQVIELDKESTNYRLERGVREEHEILHVQLLGAGSSEKAVTIVTCTDEILSIWNLAKLEKVLSMELKYELRALVTAMRPVYKESWTSFAFLANNL